MSKTNDNSNLATFEHHNTLADSELAAVTGGTIACDWEALRAYAGAVSVAAVVAHETVHAR
jgi:hypothetical protein